jgi:hypothetical protein
MEELGYMDQQYFNVKVEYTQDEENKALETMPCYVTQLTPKEIKEDYERKIKDKLNTSYFRRFAVEKSSKLKNNF